MDLRPAVAKLRMIEVSRVVGFYLRTAWENDVYRAYFDGHESGSRYAWSKAGKEGEPSGCEAEEDLREENAETPRWTRTWRGSRPAVIPSMFGSLGSWGFRVSKSGTSGCCLYASGIRSIRLAL